MTPFTGAPAGLLDSVKSDPVAFNAILGVWTLEWLENASTTLMWWPPTRRSLAEVFGVALDAPAASVDAAKAHFAANPKDILVANVVEPGVNGDVKFSIMRTSVTAKSSIADLLKTGESFWDWYIRECLVPLGFALDTRVLGVLDSVISRAVLLDASKPGEQVTSVMKSACDLIVYPEAWMLSAAVKARLSANPLFAKDTGARVVVGAPKASALPHKTCVLRGVSCGHHVVIADAVWPRITLGDKGAFVVTTEIWHGVGIDTTSPGGGIPFAVIDYGVGGLV
jgi:hypothetical protein